MLRFSFTKVQGLGNDFVLVNGVTEAGFPDDYTELAKQVCDRHFGIGADGLVMLLDSGVADVRMRIFNSDGSEAEMCGNVTRCVAKYLYEHGVVSRRQIKVETLAGIMVPEVIVDEGRVIAVKVDMGVPRLSRQEIPMVGPDGQVINEPLTVNGVTYHVTAVSMGNPHCIIYVPDLDSVKLEEIGPVIETDPAFPRKTNVEFVQVISPEYVKMKVWERGAGPTMACGTGACATGVAGVLNKLHNRQVTVELPGGPLLIHWSEQDNHIYMTGPAEEVFTGEYETKTYL